MIDIIDQILVRIPGDTEHINLDEIRVMTIRLPAALHEALKDEARRRRVSANKLAIAKLAIRGEMLDRVVAATAKQAEFDNAQRQQPLPQ